MRLCEDFAHGLHRDALPYGGERKGGYGQCAYPLLFSRRGGGSGRRAGEHPHRRGGQLPGAGPHQGARRRRLPRGDGFRGASDGRGSEPDRFDCGQPHPVPRARRRQPCVDGLEHDAPGRAPSDHRSPDRRHGYREGHDFGQPDSDRGRGRRRGGFRRRHEDPDQVRAHGGRDPRVVRSGGHDLYAAALPPHEPEHLDHAASHRPDGRQGHEGADPYGGILDAERRAGAGPQPEGGLHALEGIQLRGRHRDLGAHPARGHLHVGARGRVHHGGARHEARRRGADLGHPERFGGRHEGPRRQRYRPHRRQHPPGRHPHRQDHPEGRERSVARGEAPARDLRRQGRRREGRFAQGAAFAARRGDRHEALQPRQQGGQEGQECREDAARQARREVLGRDRRADQAARVQALDAVAGQDHHGHHRLLRRGALSRRYEVLAEAAGGDRPQVLRREDGRGDGLPEPRLVQLDGRRAYGRPDRGHDQQLHDRVEEGRRRHQAREVQPHERRRAAADGRYPDGQGLYRQEAQAEGGRQDGRTPRQQGYRGQDCARRGHAVPRGRNDRRYLPQPAGRAFANEPRADLRGRARLGRPRAGREIRHADLRRRLARPDQRVHGPGRTAAQRPHVPLRRRHGRAFRPACHGGRHLHAQAGPHDRRQDARAFDRSLLAHHAAAARR